MSILNFLNRALDRLFVVAGAIFGAQFPEFIQQYKQRLAGHVAELQRMHANLVRLAEQSNKSLEAYIGKFLESGDRDFAGQGGFMQEIVIRFDQLQSALEHLTASSWWERPFVFFKEIQWDIARSTYGDFQPGLNLSPEGFFYIALGAFLGYLVFRGLCRFVVSILSFISFPSCKKIQT